MSDDTKPLTPFGPAWRIPPGEEHLYNRQLLNMMNIDKKRAMASLLRVRDANFVRDFHEFAEKLKLKPNNYKHLSSRKHITEVVDMIRTTLKGSVLSVQSLVWRTGRLMKAVLVIQRWVRGKVREIRRVKAELRVRWRQLETQAREKIREEIDRRSALHFGAPIMTISSAAATSAAARALMHAAQERSRVSPMPLPKGMSAMPSNSSSPAASLRRPSGTSRGGTGGHGAPIVNSGDKATTGAAEHLADAATNEDQPKLRIPTPAGHKIKRRSPAEQRIHDLLWALLSDSWMDDEIMEAAIHRCLMHRRCRYVDCFRVWKATSLRDFRSRADTMNVTRTAMKLLECAMSLRFPRIQFTLEGVSIDELAYHAVAIQMDFPAPRPSVPPARPFVQYMPPSIWDMVESEEGDEEEESEASSSTTAAAAAAANGGEGDDDDAGGHVGAERGEEDKDKQQQQQQQDKGDDNHKMAEPSQDGEEASSSFAAAAAAAGAASDDVKLSQCTFSPTGIKKTPAAPLPSKSMCYRQEHAEMMGAHNEQHQQQQQQSVTIDESKNNDDDDDDHDDNNERKGWTQEEIAEQWEPLFGDPISKVLKHTQLPIEDVSGGVKPPFNFYHALLTFDPKKIFLYAYMKQAVCGRRVLLESQLHGPEPRQQAEQAIHVLQTWVLLRTVRALSSDEIATLDITPRPKYDKNGLPVARVCSFDERKSSPVRFAQRADKVAATIDHDGLRVSPPRQMLEKLIRPDVPASSAAFSTVHGVDADAGNIDSQPFKTVMLEHKRPGTALAGGRRKSAVVLGVLHDEEKRKEALERRKMAAAAASKFGIRRPSPSSVLEAAKKAEHRTPTPSGASAVTPSSSHAENQQQQPNEEEEHHHHNFTPAPLNAKSFPMDLSGLRSLLPPPCSASVSAAPSPAASSARRGNKFTVRPPATIAAASHSARPVSNSNAVSPSASCSARSHQQQHRAASSAAYLSAENFACSEEEYVEREFKHKMEFEQRYVAPIRQRKSAVNNSMFVSSQRRVHATEAKLKGKGVVVAHWHPGE